MEYLFPENLAPCLFSNPVLYFSDLILHVFSSDTPLMICYCQREERRKVCLGKTVLKKGLIDII